MKVIIDLKVGTSRVTQTIYCDKSKEDIMKLFGEIIKLASETLKNG